MGPAKNFREQNPTLTPNNAVLDPSFQIDRNLETLELAQMDLKKLAVILFFTQIAVIALLISICVLLITFRVRDGSKKTTRIEFPLEEMDEDVPPPPYRNHASGFVI